MKDVIISMGVSWLVIALTNIIISICKDKKLIIDSGLLVAFIGGPLVLVELLRGNKK